MARRDAAPAIDCSYPEQMIRELQAVRSTGDRLAWSVRWAEQLSGRAAQAKIAAARPPPDFRRASTAATRPGL